MELKNILLITKLSLLKILRTKRFILSLLLTLVAGTVVVLGLQEHKFTLEALPPDFNSRKFVEDMLEEAMKHDKGRGCIIPQLDPFTDFVPSKNKTKQIICKGKDWAECYFSKCRIKPEILAEMTDVVCYFRDKVYEYFIGEFYGDAVFEVRGDQIYELRYADSLTAYCYGTDKRSNKNVQWHGPLTGIRKSQVPEVSPFMEDSPDIFILAFDSASKNGFIRHMPKTYEYLTNTLKTTIMNGYNIVGDGTPAAMFPLLAGKNEFELPSARKELSNDTLDTKNFIFHKLKLQGYRTAYFEDSPHISTFHYRFNGFEQNPADHYLRSYFTYDNDYASPNCIGDTPVYKKLINVTDQFLRQDGKHFCLTFIGDITHDDFDLITVADEDTVAFLDTLHQRGTFNNTMLIVMGDHGPRYSDTRNLLKGKFEERLPFLAILLPSTLKKKRPEAQEHLENNTSVLTTAHDIHATILDVLDLNHLRNPYRVKGTHLMRGLSLIRHIPRSRSCSEAGIQPHWCSCVNWNNVSASDRLYKKMADEFVNYVNNLTESHRDKCAIRTLNRIDWILKQQPNEKLVTFDAQHVRDFNTHITNFTLPNFTNKTFYQIKLALDPSTALYEATGVYDRNCDRFQFNKREISRINRYNTEPACISKTNPELSPFCYCKH